MTKAKRASAPKVRTGCLLCKKSHLKCDEQQPACRRCAQRRETCTYPMKYLKTRTGTELPMRASEQFSQSRFIRPAPDSVSVLRTLQPSANPLRFEEVIYFDHFRHVVIPHFGQEHSEFWRRTVVRESSHDDIIRHTLIALGALGHALNHCNQGSFNTPATASGRLFRTELRTIAHGTRYEHYRQALIHYTKAISLFRRLLSTPSSDQRSARTVLITTMLFMAFESLQGNAQAADQLCAHSMSLLRPSILSGCLKTRSERPAPAIAGSVDDEGVYEAEAILVRNIMFHGTLSPLYPHSRRMLHQLPIADYCGPPPPDLRDDSAVFSRAWTHCMVLCCLWYTRLRDPTLLGKSASSASMFSQHAQEQADITAWLESWRAVAEQKLLLARAARDHKQVGLIRDILFGVSMCHYSVRGALRDSTRQVRSKDRDHYTATAALLSEIEQLAKPIAEHERTAAAQRRRQGDAVGKGSSRNKSNSSNEILRQHGAIYEGSRALTAHVIHQIQYPDLRRRAMALWRTGVSGHSHWYNHGLFLGSQAVFELEEGRRDPVAGLIPLAEQWNWVGGSWNDDYSEFRVDLVAKGPRQDGAVAKRTVVMPALTS